MRRKLNPVAANTLHELNELGAGGESYPVEFEKTTEQRHRGLAHRLRDAEWARRVRGVTPDGKIVGPQEARSRTRTVLAQGHSEINPEWPHVRDSRDRTSFFRQMDVLSPINKTGKRAKGQASRFAMHSTPASLLDRLRKPNEAAAWDRFVELYSPLLFHWAKRLGQQDSDAADLVQDVFLLLFRKLPDFEYDPQRRFQGWLRTLFLNQYRVRLRSRVALPLENVAELLASTPPDDFEDRRFLIQRALRLIERDFSPVLWKAFQEYALAGRSADEIAKELQISRGTIYSVKSKIIHLLRHEFKHLLD